MEDYGIEVKGEEFIIKGDFPEAVRCGEIPETNHLVYQLKSLQLCNMDLQSICLLYTSPSPRDTR